MVDWSDSASLILLNRGTAPICVRPQGSSLVDVSWANPAAARDVRGWHVDPTIEKLSDHVGIVIEFGIESETNRTRNALQRHFHRWDGKCLDVDLLVAVVNVRAWTLPRGKPVPQSLYAGWTICFGRPQTFRCQG